MDVIAQIIQYKNFGKCVELSNGIVKIIVTVDIGPRIINYSFTDGENILFEDIDRKLSATGPEWEVYGGGTWNIYGGHRLWLSPESRPRNHCPDNEPIDYEILKNGLRVKTKPQRWTQISFEMEIILSKDSSQAEITHKVTNHSPWEVNFSLWPITTLSPGGYAVIPQPTSSKGLQNNRVLSLWHYSDMSDPRVCWGNKYITLKHDAEIKRQFKFGINSEHGYAMFFNHGDMFIKKFPPIRELCYPDGGVNFEGYAHRLFLELESLSDIKKLNCGESACHTEIWSLHKESNPPKSEAEADALIEKYFG